jgi:carbon starvation protein
LWPLVGISNQLLAIIALCVCTTVLIKMGKTRQLWVTLAPLGWLAAVTMTASYQKIWDASPRIGFLAQANEMAAQIAAGKISADGVTAAHRLIFNLRIDAAVTLLFAVLVLVILAESGRHWLAYISGKRIPVLAEAPMQPSRITA